MQIPRVSPVGVLELPDGYVTTVRRRPAPVRALALALLTAFACVSIATSVLTLGAYCLTSEATTPAPLGRR
jgi:hypothetical protein